MLTVPRDSQIIFDSLAAGASGYLLKPPTADQLIEAIRDCFAGGARCSAMWKISMANCMSTAAPMRYRSIWESDEVFLGISNYSLPPSRKNPTLTLLFERDRNSNSTT